MPKLTPIKHEEFIRRLRKFGFEGPFAGGKHLFMIKGRSRLTIPNPHRKEISVGLLRKILNQADISIQEWLDNA